MASKDFEVQQLFKVYRNGLISEELFLEQMDELCSSLKRAARQRSEWTGGARQTPHHRRQKNSPDDGGRGP